MELCTVKEYFIIKHKTFSSSLSILPKQSVPSHDHVQVVHTIPLFLHDTDDVPLLPCKIPTFAAIPLSLLGLSLLPMMELISHPCYQVGSLVAKTSFLLSPQIQMFKYLEELKDAIAKLPNMVWKLLLKNPFGYRRTAR